MPKQCVWPANPCKACGARVDQGKLCAQHMQRVQAMIGLFRDLLLVVRPGT